MTKEQIEKILIKAGKMEFLDLIEFLAGEEKEYNRGEFYKKTRIPLLQLFKEYVSYNRTKESIVNRALQDLLRYEDYEKIAEKVVDIFDYLNKNPEVVAEFEKFFYKFLDSQELKSFSEELNFKFNKIKN